MADGNTIKNKILLIDDNVIYLSTAASYLADEYEVFKATSGTEALGYLYDHEFTPDLIILDILMPDMDGWEVFNRIRAIGILKNVPIAFLTSVEGEREIVKARELGAADYIIKPYNMADLRVRLKEILKGPK